MRLLHYMQMSGVEKHEAFILNRLRLTIKTISASLNSFVFRFEFI